MTVDISRGSPLSWSFWSLVGRGRIKVARYAQSVYLRSQFLADEPIRIHDPATINKLHDAIEWDGVISSDWTTPDTYSQLSSKAGAYGEGTLPQVLMHGGPRFGVDQDKTGFGFSILPVTPLSCTINVILCRAGYYETRFV